MPLPEHPWTPEEPWTYEKEARDASGRKTRKYLVYDFKKKEYIDSRFGPGAYESSLRRIKPHRCIDHTQDFVDGVFTQAFKDFDFIVPFTTLIKCFREEPQRVLPKAERLQLNMQKSEDSNKTE
ncbi:hypothetical protein HK096_004902 [Nowakowskiella sp. JEL0078]|nr:hypothetical protein HK096_004902 [Nowakowskiella sp. JEL0078]